MTEAATVTATPKQSKQAKAHDISTERAACTLKEGLKCSVRTGGMELHADMPISNGGDGTAPNPGVYIRAGMASCLAILIKMTAGQMGLDLQRIDVALEMDFDNAADAPTPAPLDTRFRVGVETDASKAMLADLLDRSLSIDPFFVALRDAQSVQATINRA